MGMGDLSTEGLNDSPKLKQQDSGFGYVGARYATCDDMRKLVGEFLRKASPGQTKKFWDLIVCLRGPDWPSERPNQEYDVAQKRYGQRLDRKYRTVEVIRSAAFGGVVGGAAKSHKADRVQLPPEQRWDHFDKHVWRAAKVLGLKVEEVNYGYDE